MDINFSHKIMEKKKILYVDYDLQVGHVNFNQIHIDALMATGAEVRLVLHKYMFEHLPYPKEMYDYIIPTSLRYRDGHPLINRIIFIITLLLIRFKVKVKAYDKVIVGFCDEISLWLLPVSRNMHVFLHRAANVEDSMVKRWLCKRIARKNRFLVFNQYMGNMLRTNGINAYNVVSHGCVPAFEVSDAKTEDGYFTIFHPSAKLNENFVNNILKDERTQNYLVKRKIRLILKRTNDADIVEHSNITYLPPTIDFADYKATFVHSDAILLSYPESFRGQVSGISFECVANNKRAMIYEHQSLDYCNGFYNYHTFFNDVDGFIYLCEELRTNDDAKCVVTPETLAPDYKFLFEKE